MTLCRADIKNGRATGEVLKVNRTHKQAKVSKRKSAITSVVMRILPGEGVQTPGNIIKRHVRRHNVVFADEKRG